MITRRRFISIAAMGIAATGTALATQTAPLRRWRGRAMGADVDIALSGDAAEAELALRAARDTIRRMERLFSLYDPASYLSDLNQNGRLVSPPPEFARLFEIVDLVHAETGGLFDPTVQPVFARQLALGRKLTPDERTQFASLVGWEKINRSDGLIAFEQPAMALTLNGIAQGYASDRVFETLAAHGFNATAVNIGEYRIGDLPTDIRVETPAGLQLARSLEYNIAIATSSASGYVFADGSSHIIPPQSGHARWDTVSVSAETAAFADGYSTALMLSDDAGLADRLTSAGSARRIIMRDMSGGITQFGT